MSISKETDETKVYPIRPELSRRLEAILKEVYETENVETKSGRKFSKEENEVRLYILNQAPALGRILYINEIRRYFNNFSSDKMDAILNRLEQLDVIHLDNNKKEIIAAYPFSGVNTPHIITMIKKGYNKMYAMCAIDALGISFMFDCDVSITSICCHCHDKVEIEIKNNEIIFLEPSDTVVWYDLDLSCCAAASCCPNTNFFSSKDHFGIWHSKNKVRRGELVSISEAFYLGKFYFVNRLKE
jgi:hypothetical protein